jgi:hypothetical protein
MVVEGKDLPIHALEGIDGILACIGRNARAPAKGNEYQ